MRLVASVVLALLAATLAACGPRETRPATPGGAAAPGSNSGSVTAPVDAPAARIDQQATLAAIQKAMNELDEAAQGCWAAAATERFDIEGELDAQIEIAPGRATATIIRDTARNKRLATCLVDLLGAYPWAPPLHGQAIQLPFKFRAPDGQNVIERPLVAWNGQGKVAVAVLLDENNSGNAAASMIELALQAGGSTGRRLAERAELWYFLGAATLNGRAVAAGDMVYVPPQTARDVVAASGDVHAMIVMTPGGREGSARAGALPTREVGTSKPAGAAVFLPASAAKRHGPVAIFAEPATTKSKLLAASIITLPATTTVAEHVHERETELLYVLAGAGTVTIAGVAQPVTATSVIQIPPNTKHAFTATADVRAVQLYTPAGPEQRFKAKP